MEMQSGADSTKAGETKLFPGQKFSICESENANIVLSNTDCTAKIKFQSSSRLLQSNWNWWNALFMSE